MLYYQSDFGRRTRNAFSPHDQGNRGASLLNSGVSYIREAGIVTFVRAEDGFALIEKRLLGESEGTSPYFPPLV